MPQNYINLQRKSDKNCKRDIIFILLLYVMFSRFFGSVHRYKLKRTVEKLNYQLAPNDNKDKHKTFHQHWRYLAPVVCGQNLQQQDIMP
jgi:hypothetical protein